MCQFSSPSYSTISSDIRSVKNLFYTKKFTEIGSTKLCKQKNCWTLDLIVKIKILSPSVLIFNTTENSAADLRMSSPCGTCNEDCGPDHVKCYVCNKIYHFSRGGVMETIYWKWDTARKQGWKCSQACRTQSSTPTD